MGHFCRPLKGAALRRCRPMIDDGPLGRPLHWRHLSSRLSQMASAATSSRGHATMLGTKPAVSPPQEHAANAKCAPCTPSFSNACAATPHSMCPTH